MYRTACCCYVHVSPCKHSRTIDGHCRSHCEDIYKSFHKSLTLSKQGFESLFWHLLPPSSTPAHLRVWQCKPCLKTAPEFWIEIAFSSVQFASSCLKPTIVVAIMLGSWFSWPAAMCKDDSSQLKWIFVCCRECWLCELRRHACALCGMCVCAWKESVCRRCESLRCEALAAKWTGILRRWLNQPWGRQRAAVITSLRWCRKQGNCAIAQG